MTGTSQTASDFAGFKRAFVAQDVPAWRGDFAKDTRGIEYKHAHSLRSPRVVNGRISREVDVEAWD